MNNDMKMKRLEELLNSETFLNEIKTVTDLKGLQKKFQENGLDMTEDEVSEFCDDVLKSIEAGELDEEQLEKVSGGFALAGVLLVGGAIAISYAAGWIISRILRNKSGVCK